MPVKTTPFPAPAGHSTSDATPAERRAETLRALREKPLDLLVIGGGIVGAGVVRDAALRGLRAGLLEQHDFASGTSSRSSRLLHGGLRYLAQGRVGLVHEASVEKGILHQIAPHLAEPMPFVFPTYRKNRAWKLWKLKLGVKLYDLLCHGRNLGHSTRLTEAEVWLRLPGLLNEGLQGAVRYFDGFTNDARLVLDTLRSAEKAGALLLNYARSTASTPGSPWQCFAEDQLTGEGFAIAARAVVNATGPWAQRLPHSQVKLRLTKGVHLVVDRVRLRVPETVVMTDEKRILFAIPWGERTILGTTDTDYEGAPEAVRVESSDIAYLLGVTNRFFPGAALTEADVLSSWAGVRPLLADASGSPSEISRSHEIRSPEPNWWDVAGGKLTTYRLMAEQTVDRLLQAFRAEGQPWEANRCVTATEPLLPESETRGVSGTTPPALSREIVEHFCHQEWAVHLEDVMGRRAGWSQYGALSPAQTEEVAAHMAAALGWTPEQQAAELRSYRQQS